MRSSNTRRPRSLSHISIDKTVKQFIKCTFGDQYPISGTHRLRDNLTVVISIRFAHR